MMDLIGTTCPFEYNKNECWASVIFVVNSNDEIEILSVVSKNKNAKSFLLKKLSNKKVSRPPYDMNQIYILPFRVIKGA